MTQPRNYGKTNRRKGHEAERFYAQIFRKLGFDKCVTSRQGSRLHDDCGIDLIFLPVNPQIKAGKQRGLNPKKVLMEMKERISEKFPSDDPVFKRPNIVIIRKEVGAGNQRTDIDDLVVLTFKDFSNLLTNQKR